MRKKHFEIFVVTLLCLVLKALSLQPNQDLSLDENDDAIVILADEDTSTPADDPDSGNFATGIWGVFLWVLIALCVLVGVSIFLLRFFSAPRSASAPKPPKNQFAPQPHPMQETQPPNYQTPTYLSNAPPSEQQPRGYDNHAATLSYEDNSIFNPAPHSPYMAPSEGYQSLHNETPAYQPYNNEGQTYQSFQNEVPPYQGYPSNAPISPVYAVSSKSPSAKQPETPMFPSPMYPPLTEEKPEEPFAYLENYEPYATSLHDDHAHMAEISTKRAVLRPYTPYKVIEERVQGEDYEDQDAFKEDTNNLKAPARPAPKLSSDSFSDGKTKMVRVLPRFALGTQQQQRNNQQAENGGGGATAVFSAVPPPPPPFSAPYGGQQRY